MLEMLPFAGAVNAGQVFSAHATVDHVPLPWHVLRPPPQYPAVVLQVSVVLELYTPVSDEYVPATVLVRLAHDTIVQVGVAALHAPVGQPARQVNTLEPLMLYPTLHVKLRVCPNDPAAVLVMMPLTGAVRAGQEFKVHPVTAVHVPLLWHVLTPPPQ